MLNKILEDVKKVIREAGKEVMKYYGKSQEELKTVFKDKIKNDSPVTLADLESEKIIIDQLKKYNYGILSEETDEDNDRAGKERVWVIDPLDGTMDFTQKTDEFSIIIGLAENGKPVLGVIFQPVKDKMYFAVKSQGAYLEQNGHRYRLEVNKKNSLDGQKILISRNHLRGMEQRLIEKYNIQSFPSGSAGIKIGLVAEQVGDIYINSSSRTGEWDICAGDIILAEAGGKITDLGGSKIVYNKNNPLNLNGFAISNGLVHDELISAIKGLSSNTDAL